MFGKIFHHDLTFLYGKYQVHVANCVFRIFGIFSCQFINQVIRAEKQIIAEISRFEV